MDQGVGGSTAKDHWGGWYPPGTYYYQVIEPKSLRGWECPKCGQVFSPFIQKCDTCGGGGYYITYSGGTDGLQKEEEEAEEG